MTVQPTGSFSAMAVAGLSKDADTPAGVLRQTSRGKRSDFSLATLAARSSACGGRIGRRP